MRETLFISNNITMEELLMQNFQGYLTENNPELLVELQEQLQLTTYMNAKLQSIEPMVEELIIAGLPAYEISAQCMASLTADLRPSRYRYILGILEEEFPEYCQRITASGLLVYEGINLVTGCAEVFKLFEFSEQTQDNRLLYYAVTGVISEHIAAA